MLKATLITRLNEIHDIEFEDISYQIRNKAPKEFKYNVHRLMYWLILVFGLLFVCSGAFIVGII
jgi:hypothetical protein